MPLTDLGLNASLSWTLTAAVAGFLDRVQGPDGLGFNLSADPAVWENIFLAQYAILPGGTQEFDVHAFTDLDASSVTATAGLGIFILPTGGNVTFTPGTTNPLNWFFNGGSATTTAGLTLYRNGVFVNTGPGSDTIGNVTIGASAKNLRLVNGSGSDTVTAYVGMILK